MTVTAPQTAEQSLSLITAGIGALTSLPSVTPEELARINEQSNRLTQTVIRLFQSREQG